MVVFAAFVPSAAHGRVLVCCRQTFNIDTALPWAGDSQGGSAPSAKQSLKDKVTWRVLEQYHKELCDLRMYWAGDAEEGNITCLSSLHILIRPLLHKRAFFSPVYCVIVTVPNYVHKEESQIHWFFLSLCLYLWHPSSRLCIWAVRRWKTAPYAFICHEVCLVLLKVSVLSLPNQESFGR